MKRKFKNYRIKKERHGLVITMAQVPQVSSVGLMMIKFVINVYCGWYLLVHIGNTLPPVIQPAWLVLISVFNNLIILVLETTKVLNMLMSNTTPFIKKRQLMRVTFGDYRTKMLEESRKLSKGKKSKYCSFFIISNCFQLSILNYHQLHLVKNQNLLKNPSFPLLLIVILNLTLM